MSLPDSSDTSLVRLPRNLKMHDAMQALRFGLGYTWIRLTSETVALGIPPNHSLPDLIAVKTQFVTSATEGDVTRLEAALKAIVVQKEVMA